MEEIELQKIKNKYDIVGNNLMFNHAIKMAVAVGYTDLTVVITGESGVGKDVIPKIIHQNSRRKNEKYFAINCGAIPEGTIDSELFGHEKGSFTGALEMRKGYFEEANGGTLFLDEIGELPLASQAKLLRVLQSGEFIKVGSSRVQKTDVRVIAATNINLVFAVSQGKFREDLYYRINAIQIAIPSLRERKEDIYLLFRKFTSDFSEKYNMSKISLSHKAIEILSSYRWPGNVRQLKNITETITALQSQLYSNGKEKIELDEDGLLPYMPKDECSLLPATSVPESNYLKDRDNIFSSSDRNVFIKAFLDLKHEVDKLKAIILNSNINFIGESQQKAHFDINDNFEIAQSSKDNSPHLVNSQYSLQSPKSLDTNTILHFDSGRNDNKNEEGEHAPEDQDFEDLSISRLSEDLLRKALDRNKGNRKLAALELGISERTLYRRLSKDKK